MDTFESEIILSILPKDFWFENNCAEAEKFSDSNLYFD